MSKQSKNTYTFGAGYPNAPPAEDNSPPHQPQLHQPHSMPQPQAPANYGFAAVETRGDMQGKYNAPVIHPMPAPGSGYLPPTAGPGPAYAPVPTGPIVQQPQMAPQNPDGWMSIPVRVTRSPPGLEYLMTVDQLLCKQTVELFEAFTGFESNNKYMIKNALGQKVYYAVEDTDCCTRNLCGSSRPFDMKIFDNFGKEVIHIYRPFNCGCQWVPICLQEILVSAPPGHVIGKIEQEASFCAPSWKVKNNIGDVVMRIEGPLIPMSCCMGSVDFDVLTLTGEKVGRISKNWSGLGREAFTDADSFGLTFPLDLDVRVKALLLGATFLIDFMFFEKNN